ncbi:MAG: heparinase [Planctomycetes bacterium]|nr:heparinase [Planctomycetota bacterium]
MQRLNWYIRRLGAMTPGELGDRARASLRDRVGRRRVRRRGAPCPAVMLCRADVPAEQAGFAVTPVPVGAWAARSGPPQRWMQRLRLHAEPILRGRLSFFDLHEQPLGTPVDWHRDHGSGRAAPRRYAPAIDYRDVRVTGDCKYVWEPNRHHHWVVLGRAYRATGDERYARAVVDQLDSWLDQCPFGYGMPWRSPLELAVRLINWVWALDLIAPADVITPVTWRRALHAVDLHLWEISRKFSVGSSANNHLIGEAAGAFVAACYFPALSRSAETAAVCREILCEQVHRQILPDGGSAEQAVGYELFVLQLLLAAGIAARRTGADFPDAWWAVLERMGEFLGALCEGGPVPMMGDCDDGYVLDLGDGPRRPEPWLTVLAALLGRPDGFGVNALDWLEPSAWLLGATEAARTLSQIAIPDKVLTHQAFPRTGLYLLQCGRRDGDDRISVGFDCGSHGLGPLAAHGHADALGVTLRAFGRDVLVDPGTYDYFTWPAWREYFRSTRAHNTVEIDGRDQSVSGGPFLWTRQAGAWCTLWSPDEGRVVGEHDGYTRLRDPVVHRRSVTLDPEHRTVTLRDDVIARRFHDAALRFHVAEGAEILDAGDNRFEILLPGAGKVTLSLDPAMKVEVARAGEDPIAGWVSRGYHQKSPAATITARRRTGGMTSLITRLHVEPPEAS